MSEHSRAVREIFDESEVREVLKETFYRDEPSYPIEPSYPADASPPKRKRAKAKPKPDHYEVICISMYKEDLERLDDRVALLKKRGLRRMTRSGLIRWALDQLDIESVPKGF